MIPAASRRSNQGSKPPWHAPGMISRRVFPLVTRNQLWACGELFLQVSSRHSCSQCEGGGGCRTESLRVKLRRRFPAPAPLLAHTATIAGGQQAAAVNHAQVAYFSGRFFSPGDSQYSLYVLRGSKTSNPANPTSYVLTHNNSGSEIALPVNQTIAYSITLVARESYGAGLSSAFFIRGYQRLRSMIN